MTMPPSSTYVVFRPDTYLLKSHDPSRTTIRCALHIGTTYIKIHLEKVLWVQSWKTVLNRRRPPPPSRTLHKSDFVFVFTAHHMIRWYRLFRIRDLLLGVKNGRMILRANASKHVSVQGPKKQPRQRSQHLRVSSHFQKIGYIKIAPPVQHRHDDNKLANKKLSLKFWKI